MQKIGGLKYDGKNANRGTERGRKALGVSLTRYGAGRLILLDKKDRVIAGAISSRPRSAILRCGTRTVVRLPTAADAAISWSI